MFEVVEEDNKRVIAKKDPRKQVREVYEMQLQDYSANTKIFIDMLNDLKNTGMNVVLISHSEFDEKAGLFVPDIHAKVRKVICGSMDIVGFMEICDSTIVDLYLSKGGQLSPDNNVYRLWFNRSGYEVKDRSPGRKLGNSMFNPTMQKIYTTINNQN